MYYLANWQRCIDYKRKEKKFLSRQWQNGHMILPEATANIQQKLYIILPKKTIANMRQRLQQRLQGRALRDLNPPWDSLGMREPCCW